MKVTLPWRLTSSRDGVAGLRLSALAGYFSLWTFVGLSEFTSQLHDQSRRNYWLDGLVIYLVVAYIWAFLAPAVVWLARLFPIERPRKGRHVLMHVVFSVLFTCGVALVFTGISLMSGVGRSLMTMTFTGVLVPAFVTGIHQHLFTYWVIIGIYHAFRYHHAFIERDRQAASLELRASELKTELRRAQLSALRAQLEPHFLFNTLNAIMVLVRQRSDPDSVEMLRRLRELLECVLRDAEVQEVPLDREFEYLRLYLAIEQVRFRDRLRVEMSAEPGLHDAAVAYMCLQPIVENAIRHGVARSSRAGTVRIKASRERDTLRLLVQDDGPGFDGLSFPRRSGIGLANTRARLEKLYGDRAALRVERLPQGGTIATIVMPYHVLDQSASAGS
jgi:sensor histidine kinase YesM